MYQHRFNVIEKTEKEALCAEAEITAKANQLEGIRSSNVKDLNYYGFQIYELETPQSYPFLSHGILCNLNPMIMVNEEAIIIDWDYVSSKSIYRVTVLTSFTKLNIGQRSSFFSPLNSYNTGTKI